jgi:hypothetical protein
VTDADRVTRNGGQVELRAVHSRLSRFRFDWEVPLLEAAQHVSTVATGSVAVSNRVVGTDLLACEDNKLPAVLSLQRSPGVQAPFLGAVRKLGSLAD